METFRLMTKVHHRPQGTAMPYPAWIPSRATIGVAHAIFL